MVNTKTFMSIVGLKCQNHIIPFPSDESIANQAQNTTNICMIIFKNEKLNL
jgi:hypothetical protein